MNELCYLSEIYSAVQGEGPLVGIRQIFLRFASCDLRCVWCDTPDSLIRTEKCLVEVDNGQRLFEEVGNPISVEDLLQYIQNLEPKLHHSISITGGEPLLQSNFLSDFLPRLKTKFNIPIYLESGGHRFKELNEIINYVDFVSMDIKLPSSAKTEGLWEKHKRFLEISLSLNKHNKTWIKLVVASDTLMDEVIRAIEIVKTAGGIEHKTEIFIQPVSEINGIVPPNEKQLLFLQKESLKLYPFIRIVPQVHALIGQK